jgi:hypothetical protein
MRRFRSLLKIAVYPKGKEEYWTGNIEMIGGSHSVGGASARVLLLSTFATFFCGLTPASSAPIVSLGAAASYGVLAGQTVTNSGGTIIDGDVGVSPGTAITGFGPGPGLLGPGIVNGTQFAGPGSAAATAQTNLTTAFNNLAGLACGTTLTGNLGSLAPLKPGVYCFSSAAQLTGTLTLDEQGLDNQEFVFQIASTLNTATNSSVIEINPGPTADGADNNIFWEIGSSASLGTGTQFVGDIVALTSISLGTGARISCGAALAQNGSVTLLDNAITAGTDATCVADAANFVVPEPSTLMVLGTALFGLIGSSRSRKRSA